MSGTIRTQALRFAAVGVLNTAVGLGVIFAGMAVLGLGDVAANALGYAVGLVVSFLGNRSWTFRHRGPWRGALVRFVAVFAGAYLVNLLTMLSVRDGLRWGSYAAQIAGTLAYPIVFFLGSRSLAVRKPCTPPS